MIDAVERSTVRAFSVQLLFWHGEDYEAFVSVTSLAAIGAGLCLGVRIHLHGEHWTGRHARDGTRGDRAGNTTRGGRRCRSVGRDWRGQFAAHAQSLAARV